MLVTGPWPSRPRTRLAGSPRRYTLEDAPHRSLTSVSITTEPARLGPDYMLFAHNVNVHLYVRMKKSPAGSASGGPKVLREDREMRHAREAWKSIVIRTGHTLTLLQGPHGPLCAIGLHRLGHAGLTPVAPQPMLGLWGEAPDSRERRGYMTVTPEEMRRGTRPVDFVNVGSLLSQEEKEIRGRVRSFVDEHVIPAAAGYWDRAEFPFDLLPGLGELGILG